MSTTSTTPVITAAAVSIDAFLLAIAAGTGIPADVYAPDAALDATVPNWRFRVDGPSAIAAEYSRWFASPGSFAELTRSPLPDGEVITYVLSWTEDGVPHAAHHCHVIRLTVDGLIGSDTVFCGGRWPAALLAEMAAAT